MRAADVLVSCDSGQKWVELSLDQALVLVTKAKLELVAEGLSTIQRDFLADLVLPDGSTVGRALEAPIAEAYATGRMPPLLPGCGDG